MYRILDLFCGTGGISHGLKRYSSKFKVIGGVDLDPAACSTASANHPEGKFICDSIAAYSPKYFAEVLGNTTVDMIVGGPPCQGFSSLRPNRQTNIDDPRNQLFRHFIEYVKYFQPSVFLMENVVGLLSASHSQLLGEIIEGFRNAGYDVDWRVLNAANYGVPQKRERLILAGLKAPKRRAAVIKFPPPTHYFKGRVIGTRFKDNYVVNSSSGMPALTVAEAISDLPELESGQKKSSYGSSPQNSFQSARRANSSGMLTLHEAANHSEKMLRVIRMAGSSKTALPAGLVSSGFSSCYSRMEAHEPATTITVKFTSPASSKCIHPKQDRAITPREAARLQSFDDGFVFCGSKTDIANQLGNAVPPLLGEALAPMFIETLERRYRG